MLTNSVLYAGPDSNGQILLLLNSGSEIPLGDRLKERSLEQGFSELTRGSHAGRRFVFASYGTESPTAAQAAAAYEKHRYGHRLYNCVTGGRLNDPLGTAAQRLAEAHALLSKS